MRTFILASLLLTTNAYAEQVYIRDAWATPQGNNQYQFSVTLQHNDEGWQHYANSWHVVAPDGDTILGTRTLHHPHVHEQPFTRSLGGVVVPPEYDEVIIRATDSLHGLSHDEFRLKLR